MDQDLLDLLAAWGSGGFDETRRAVLLGRLRCDEAFRRAFVSEVHMLGTLKAVQATEPRWLLLEDELGWSADQRPAGTPLEDRVMRDIRRLGRSQATRIGKWGGLAAALLLVGLLSLFWLRDRRELPPPPGVPPYVAVVVRLDGAHWGPGEGPELLEGSPLPAGVLRLRSGRMTLTFFNGVMVSLQGPVELDLKSIDRIFCQQGKLRARVPPGAEGFAVLAPGSAVVDLGTEFGLNVAPDGTAQLMVFEGQAEFSVLNADGHTLRNQLLQKNMAAEVDPSAQRIRNVAAVPSHYVAAPELVPPSLVLDPAYADVIRAAQPWGYWRFETLANRLVANEVPGGPPLLAVGPLVVAGSPGANGSVLFAPTPLEQHLILDGTWTPPAQVGYAVELWALSEEFNTSTLLSLLSHAVEPAQNHSLLLEFTGLSHHLIHDPCRVRYLDRWPPGGVGGTNVFSRQMYIPYRWHHLVAQKVQDRLELYLNGELAGTAPAGLNEPTTACRLLVGRLKYGPQPNLTQIRPFVGRLDELAVYDHPLSPAEIRRHYELGAVSSRLPE